MIWAMPVARVGRGTETITLEIHPAEIVLRRRGSRRVYALTELTRVYLVACGRGARIEVQTANGDPITLLTGLARSAHDGSGTLTQIPAEAARMLADAGLAADDTEPNRQSFTRNLANTPVSPHRV
ncbi:hypothetical protein D9V34_10665 [Mycetocola lacteus]|uniref:Uncharacterized protein n=1 Tax=Mycetocola lacteus TaxID=76637 RepID=A0A3L7ARI9_9MICO|nr:hypothetical protein [Mycetocola lacteus]RLP82251.1 hypothetical protein D9V34_10665 [Mycetocola lacteus]